MKLARTPFPDTPPHFTLMLASLAGCAFCLCVAILAPKPLKTPASRVFATTLTRPLPREAETLNPGLLSTAWARRDVPLTPQNFFFPDALSQERSAFFSPSPAAWESGVGGEERGRFPSRAGFYRLRRNSESEYAMETPLLRIGLMRLTRATTITLRAEPGAHLFGPDGTERSVGSGPWTIYLTGYGAKAVDGGGRDLGIAASGTCWRLQSDDENTRLEIAAPGDVPRHYRGCLEVEAASGKQLRAINETTLETYLRGVVPCEIGGRSPLEAQKAQAVAARTFALNSLLRGQERNPTLKKPRRANARLTSADDAPLPQNFDLRDDTGSQVYGGIDSETPQTDQAVAETDGQILMAGGLPVAAFFCADCGGVTTPGATSDSVPHSVVDADGKVELHHTTWSLRYTPDQFAALLAKEPQAIAPGTLEKVEVVEKDVSGRVRRLRFTWRPVVKPATLPVLPVPTLPSDTPPDEQETQPPAPTPDDPVADPVEPTAPQTGPTPPTKPITPPVKPAAPPILREMAGNTLRTLLGVNTLRSTLFTVTRTPEGDFVLSGRGWGHGRGMCQVGAMALAARAHDYKFILKHYYAGTTLARVVYMDEREPPEQNVSSWKEGSYGR